MRKQSVKSRIWHGLQNIDLVPLTGQLHGKGRAALDYVDLKEFKETTQKI